MNEDVFRKKSLDKVKSPENLDDYIRVSNPGVWLLLVSVVVLLLGACVWGVFGHIDGTVDANVSAEDGRIICYVAEDSISSVKVGMTVEFEDFTAEIAETGQKENSRYICVLQSEQQIPDGIYDGKIIISRIRPMSFVVN